MHDRALEGEPKWWGKRRFSLSPGVTVRELDWDYFPPEGVVEGSPEWWEGYRQCLKNVARWYENERARYRLTQMNSKEIVD